jgi:glycosyltransferase involved in cell wall biosynthesis
MYASHVITRLIIGGAQENTISTVLGLHQKKGVQVELISGPTDPSMPEGSLQSRVESIPGIFIEEPHLIRRPSLWHDWLAYRQLKRRFQSTRPTLVHTHSGKAGIVGRLAAKAARIPLIIHSIHGPSFGNFQGTFSNCLFLGAERWAGKATNHFVGVAEAMCQQYLDAGIGEPNQYSTIYSGFNLEPFLGAETSSELRSKYGLKDNDFVVGKIARLFDLKGHDTLFDALPRIIEKIPQLKLLLIGGGPLRDVFEQRLCAMGMRDKVVFTGLVPPEEVPSLVGLVDVLVHLSLREGLPRALPQAMAAGKPVVAVSLDGAPEVCIPGKTGFLVNSGNVSELVDALISLGEDACLRKRLGVAGKKWVKQRYSVDTMVDATFALYQRLLASRGIPGRY